MFRMCCVLVHPLDLRSWAADIFRALAQTTSMGGDGRSQHVSPAKSERMARALCSKLAQKSKPTRQAMWLKATRSVWPTGTTIQTHMSGELAESDALRCTASPKTRILSARKRAVLFYSTCFGTTCWKTHSEKDLHRACLPSGLVAHLLVPSFTTSCEHCFGC